jgi:hypothetical protein
MGGWQRRRRDEMHAPAVDRSTWLLQSEVFRGRIFGGFAFRCLWRGACQQTGAATRRACPIWLDRDPRQTWTDLTLTLAFGLRQVPDLSSIRSAALPLSLCSGDGLRRQPFSEKSVQSGAPAQVLIIQGATHRESTCQDPQIDSLAPPTELVARWACWALPTLG